MREIKFRVWDKENKKMYYGYEPNRPNMITFDGEICAQTLKGMDIYGNPLAKIDYYPQERFILIYGNWIEDEFEVIGNIFDNPELLKEGKE